MRVARCNHALAKRGEFAEGVAVPGVEPLCECVANSERRCRHATRTHTNRQRSSAMCGHHREIAITGVIRCIQQTTRCIGISRDDGVYVTIVSRRDDELRVVDIAALVRPPIHFESTRDDELFEFSIERNRDDTNDRACQGKLLGLPGRDGSAANDEHAKAIRLDQNWQATHRNRPPPFASVKRTATYSTTTHVKLTLE